MEPYHGLGPAAQHHCQGSIIRFLWGGRLGKSGPRLALRVGSESLPLSTQLIHHHFLCPFWHLHRMQGACILIHHCRPTLERVHFQHIIAAARHPPLPHYQPYQHNAHHIMITAPRFHPQSSTLPSFPPTNASSLPLPPPFSCLPAQHRSPQCMTTAVG